MLLSRVRVAPAYRKFCFDRAMSSLSSNPHIVIFPYPTTLSSSSFLLTYLERNPPTPRLAIGTTTALPPTPQSFSENHDFLSILNDVLRRHAAQDPDLQAQARAFAGPGGAGLGSGGAFFLQQRTSRGGTKSRASSLGAGGGGGASGQGGAGGGGVGGHVHLSDLRNPPDYGRIASPEDILGSIEVDGHGDIVGDFQPSGTYRILTNEGM
ncbi:hypothetical protein F4809DRAFT_469988 [Biscogniauxia mediterranea]|nr:hypothetical protein F4809DRAFT_469988 [Biscogniauxia mediterranea]